MSYITEISFIYHVGLHICFIKGYTSLVTLVAFLPDGK